MVKNKTRIVCFYFVFLSIKTLIAQTPTKTLSCLFLGNSYTYVNNLPNLIDSLAAANGDDLVFDQNTPGGHTFNNHFNNLTSISKINQQAWQYVVLQAQSQEPSFSPSQVNAQTLPYAIKLDSVINQNNACTQTVFFETWGRKFGDAGNCGAYPPVCTYTGMQNRLRASYKLFADTTKSIMSPVGEAFKASITYSPTIDLYQGDQSHPSLEGSYLAACVFYEVLFKKSCINNAYKAGLSNNVASHLQLMANKTVNDSLLTWNIGVYEPHAAFTHTANANTHLFQSVSTTSLFTHTWHFGDGTTSSVLNPTKTYTTAGTFLIKHVVKNNCMADTAYKTVTSLPTSIKNNLLSKICISPNPVDDVLFLHNNEKIMGSYKIYNTESKLIASGVLTANINVKDLPKGIYFIYFNYNGVNGWEKFVKD